MPPEVAESITVVLSFLVTTLFALLTKTIVKRMGTGAAQDAALELTTASEVVVRNVAQTVKPKLLKAAADGKLSDEDKQLLKDTALTMLREQLSEEARKIVTKHGAQSLDRAIEAAVNKIKGTP